MRAPLVVRGRVDRLPLAQDGCARCWPSYCVRCSRCRLLVLVRGVQDPALGRSIILPTKVPRLELPDQAQFDDLVSVLGGPGVPRGQSQCFGRFGALLGLELELAEGQVLDLVQSERFPVVLDFVASVCERCERRGQERRSKSWARCGRTRSRNGSVSGLPCQRARVRTGEPQLKRMDELHRPESADPVWAVRRGQAHLGRLPILVQVPQMRLGGRLAAFSGLHLAGENG